MRIRKKGSMRDGTNHHGVTAPCASPGAFRARARSAVAAVVAAQLAVTWSPLASAAPTREECVGAHSRGQDLREKGQLSQARQLFMSCAQSSCPALIQGDCARFGEDIDRILPSITFAARDAKQADLPDTYVYVDDALVATRLDDGKSHELDPGRHAIRFVHDGKEITQQLVVNQGEKGRLVVAAFGDAQAPRSDRDPAGVAAPAPEPSRPVLPLVVAGVGGAALVAGGVLLGVGLGKVPSTCSVSSKECAAPPGDPAFDDAKSGVGLANVGIVVGGVGAVALVGGLVWYFTRTPEVRRAAANRPAWLAPWVDRRGGGVGLSGGF